MPSSPPADSVHRRMADRLARLGFTRTGDAPTLLSGPLRLWDGAHNRPCDDGAANVVAALGRTADPDVALRALATLVAAAPDADDILAELRGSAALRSRLLGILGASVALGEHLAAHPGDWTVLRDPAELDAGAQARRLHEAVGADPEAPITGSAGTPAARSGHEGAAALALAYRRALLGIAGRDLAGEVPFADTAAALADLAVAALRAALAVSAADRRAPSTSFSLAVLALGKAGGRELNYVSDIDVIFVLDVPANSADRTGADGGVDDEQRALNEATALAAGMMRVCGAGLWEVDAGLRPEGAQGPLVRTLASHEAYYRRWASTWEFQALLKARPAAGDLSLGASYLAAVEPLVWSAAERPDFVHEVQAMRRRVVAQLAPDVATRELKLGPGGLRDVEFAVQLLQLVHGRGDETLRSGTTLDALGALRDGGYVGRDDAVSLADAYRFLRATEHRLQLYRMRRTHLLPEEPERLTALARSLGFRPDARGDARSVWEAEWALHAREVRRLHEKLFYRPLLEAVARVPSDELRLSPDQAERRLGALGFAHPRGALAHIDALTSGLSRRAAIQRALLPVLLASFSDAPDPDAGLLGYRQVSDALGDAPWFLRTLRDEGKLADRLAVLLGTSRYVTSLLVGAPASLRLLSEDDELVPRSVDALSAAMHDTAARQDDPDAAVRAVRARRRTELLRIASADLLGLADLDAVMAGLSATMDATISAALEVATREVSATWAGPPPARLAVIALGRLGGRELGYGSDADVLFIYEPAADRPFDDDPATDGPGDEPTGRDPVRFATSVVERLRSSLATPGTDPAVRVDADLRPEGRDGPLVRSLASYAAYYRRWSSIWEAQALLRARYAAGDRELADRFLRLIDRVRYPDGGLETAQVLEIRRLKGRIDSERLPRGADPATHTKLGRGGLGDVEWTVQLLQLQHAHRIPALRTTSTPAALDAAAETGLLPPAASRTLRTAWRLSTRTRNAILLVRGRAEDQLPPPGPALAGVGRALGYPPDVEAGRLDDEYRRVARRARQVVEEVFYATDAAGLLSSGVAGLPSTDAADLPSSGAADLPSSGAAT